MFIEKIELENYRNYNKQEIIFNKDINIIYGNNAQGKTNIIESIFLCAYGKSFRTKKDTELIQFGKEKAEVNIYYQKEDRKGKIKAEIDNKKTFYINEIKQKKISEIVGKINIIIFTPDDIDIIKEGPERRRKFLDMMISSLRPNYIHLLNSYNNVLEQRNNYLKQIKYDNKKEEMLDVWDEQLAKFSEKIYEYRKTFIEKYKEKINTIHKMITKSGKEEIKIKYFSNGNNKEKYLSDLIKNREIDIGRGFTATGIHRDDFVIYINGKQISVYGSQGQQRTAILTLKLCELEIVKEEIGETPILLLDDFMSELDFERRNSLLENIRGNQVIITCTDKLELENNSSIFLVEEGSCKKVK